jgi:hypothetical protein
MCYISSTLDVKMQGFIGDEFELLSVELYSDADLASCKATAKSTSGVLIAIGGPHSYFAINWISNKQTCQSHSTAEAEIIAADVALRVEGIPALQLWETLSHMMNNKPMPGVYEQRFGPNTINWTIADMVADENNVRIESINIPMHFHEDNQAAIQVIKTGRNPTMRHLGRTHKIDIGWLHNVFARGLCSLGYCDTEKQAADMFTKSFAEKTKWHTVCGLVGLVDFSKASNIFSISRAHHPRVNAVVSTGKGKSQCPIQ